MSLSTGDVLRRVYEDPYAYVARKQAAIVDETRRQKDMVDHGFTVPQDRQDRLRLARDEVAIIRRALGKDKRD